MSRPLRIQYPGAIYHVTHRGNERKAIYQDEQDRLRFLDILTQSIETYDVRLHSFVLMRNHFHVRLHSFVLMRNHLHFLVETPLGNPGEFMRHFN